MHPLLYNLICFIMAKLSVLNRPKVSESYHRYSKSLDRELNWNQSAGMLIPRMSQYVPKGSKCRINRMAFTRSAQIVSPAFDRVTQHLDFFKVPLRLLYSPFNDWSLNINDLNSSLLLNRASSTNQNQLPTQLPSVNFIGLQNILYPLSYYQSPTAVVDNCRDLNDFRRLRDALEYGKDCTIGGSGSQDTNVMSLLKVACYQKIYYDHYRNTSYESNNAYAYNLDWMMDSPLADLTNSTTVSRLRNLFKLRYVNYRNDYFHNVYPSLNFVVGTPSGLDWSLPSSLIAIGSGQAGGGMGINSSTALGQTSPVLTQANNGSNTIWTNPQSIRAAFALDKLLRASAYTPKHVREQFKARFGVDPGTKVSFESERLKSYINDVTFGEVTATADAGYNSGTGTFASNVGDLGGRGVGSGRFDNDDFEFFCEEDSIIMAIQYFMPKGFYDSLGTDEFNTFLTREDFPNPETMNLGLRPIYKKILLNTGGNAVRNTIVAYTVPYQSLKLGIDKNYGLFVRSCTSSVPNSAGTAVQVDNYTGPLSTFATHNTNFESLIGTQGGLTAESLKVSPNDLDNIFKVAYSSYGDERTDQFYGWLRIKLSVVNWLSLHGQPSL